MSPDSVNDVPGRSNPEPRVQASSLGPCVRRLKQPRARRLPFALNGSARDGQGVANLLERQARKKTHLCNAALSRVEQREIGERRVQIKQVHVWRMADRGVIVDHDARPLTGTFRHHPAPGVIDQNPAHQLGCDREELRPVTPVGLPLIDEPEIGLVHKRRGLQDVSRALAAKPASRLSPQLVSTQVRGPDPGRRDPLPQARSNPVTSAEERFRSAHEVGPSCRSPSAQSRRPGPLRAEREHVLSQFSRNHLRERSARSDCPSGDSLKERSHEGPHRSGNQTGRDPRGTRGNHDRCLVCRRTSDTDGAESRRQVRSRPTRPRRRPTMYRPRASKRHCCSQKRAMRLTIAR